MVDVACPRCNIIKDSTFDYYWSGEKRHRYCKECQKKYAKNWGKNHRRNRFDVNQTTTRLEEKPA